MAAVLQLQHRPEAEFDAMIFMRKLHKWLGLVIGAQLIIWLVTGTVISLIDQAEVSGAVTRQAAIEGPSPYSFDAVLPVSEIPLMNHPAQSITLKTFMERPVYRVVQDQTTLLIDAQSGSLVVIGKALVEEVALASYRGAGQLVSTEWFEAGSNEVRDVDGPVWRVQTDDRLATRIYVSAEDGQVLAHRNSRWKIVDFLLMLHFMDYVRADSFNNLQIIVVGFGTLWIAISGMLLVFYSFSRGDFLWLPGISSRGRQVLSTVGSEGRNGKPVALDSSLSYYNSLSQMGIKLSSNCDGSGSCGLCRVHYDNDAPDPTAVDREWINATDLSDGLRLGCQHKPRADDVLTVPEFAFQQTIHQAEVVSGKWLTPLLKEIRIRPEQAIQFSPGDYLEFQIPGYDVSLEQLDIPTSFSDVWETLSIPERWSHVDSSGQVRTYSISTAPTSENPQELVFTVRFSPPPMGQSVPCGIGSSYMCGLGAGDRIAFRGPAGDFRLVDSDREKILIGGGAGMAPLKSMAIHLLEGKGWQGKLRYWYGARNQEEILYRDTFEALAKEHANFEWRVALSDAVDDEHWKGEHGLIHEAILDNVLREHQSLSDCEFYLCGPPLMLAATRQMLRDLGVSDTSVRFDDFGN